MVGRQGIPPSPKPSEVSVGLIPSGIFLDFPSIPCTGCAAERAVCRRWVSATPAMGLIPCSVVPDVPPCCSTLAVWPELLQCPSDVLE